MATRLLSTSACLFSLLLPVTLAGAAASDEEEPVVFAGSASYPPFQWQTGTGPRGFVIELQEAMAQKGGRRAVHRLGEWEDALAAVEAGEADVVALFASDPRRERFDLSAPFYYVAHGIFVAEHGRVVGHVDRMAGKRVAAVAGGFAEERLAQRAEPRPAPILVPCPDIGRCLEMVAAGQADLAVVAGHTARRLIAEQDLAVRQTSRPIWPRPYVFGVQKGRTELLEWVESSLAMTQINGAYHSIYNRWLDELEWQQRTFGDSLRLAAWVILPLAFLAMAGYGWSWTLRRRVAARTGELSRELEHREQLEEELQYRVGHDVHTHLLNREAFTEALTEMIRGETGWNGTVITIRIINLEQMITAFSYPVGYRLLGAFADRLRSLDGNLLAGHFGAGVFAVASRESVSGETMLGRVTAPLELDDMNIDPQIALGVVSERALDGGPPVAEELIRRSRTALAAAQERGRRWLEYSVELEPDPDDLLLLRDFHRVGTRDMFLLLQPKMNLATGRIDGAEALIRWKHPSLGLISPARFIPLLEQSGLISQITRWVLDEACRMAKRFREQGRVCSLSVNVAAQDLLEVDLLQLIGGLIATVSDRSGLRLEITETGFIQDPVHAREVLSDLRAAGVFCAVDDFGTGYSSLSYLSEFPVDEVKIDRSFVTDMCHNERHRLIVESTITLAHELGLRVTAEGAEDRETVEALRARGCDVVQGFVIARPLTEEALIPMIGENGLDLSDSKA